MEILEVTPSEYGEIISSPYYVFGTVAFNKLNRNKSDEVQYLLFREGKFRLGIIGGVLNQGFYSPFSAPFGGYIYTSDHVRIQYIEEAIRMLVNWAREKGYLSIVIIPPPMLYESTFIAKQVNCLWREGFEISNIDLNYSFDLACFDGNYPEHIWYNARKNLKIAMNSGLRFFECTADEEKSIAYDIISKNREGRGYPLRMSWQQIADTIQIVPADFFLVQGDRQTPVASAIVFHINKDIVQVIYWGDLQGYSEMKPMNFLSFKVFEYYKSTGKKIVDIGPSTESSIPNYGLCEFKESVGCSITHKYTLTKKLR
jgi:hypothetical protein